MGGVVSAGTNNCELVDNLVYADIVKTPEIERVFRAVDRGVYYLPEHRDGAYKDRAWKHQNLHLSAPCIYGEVMEALELQKGLSFLNLGCGTGYLSTMAGLILGPYGVNHGVEIHQDVVDYSEAHLKEFISSNQFFDAFEFCPPIFHCGNCLNLAPANMKYDRVYCGAACSPENEGYMKSLVKVGGLLVMPLGDELVQIRRMSETKWVSNRLMAVSFADLIPPDNDGNNMVELSEPTGLSLQEACREIIRCVLKKNIEDENPKAMLFSLRCNQKKCKKKNQRRINRTQAALDTSTLEDVDLDQHPFIRVSFLPSGGRIMFIQNLSDNEEEDDNGSSYHVDNGNQYSDDIHDVGEDRDVVEDEFELEPASDSNSSGGNDDDSEVNICDVGTNEETMETANDLHRISGNSSKEAEIIVNSNSSTDHQMEHSETLDNDCKDLTSEIKNTYVKCNTSEVLSSNTDKNSGNHSQIYVFKTNNKRTVDNELFESAEDHDLVNHASSSSSTSDDNISSSAGCKSQRFKKQRTDSFRKVPDEGSPTSDNNDSHLLDQLTVSESLQKQIDTVFNFNDKTNNDSKLSGDGLDVNVVKECSEEKIKISANYLISHDQEARDHLMSVSSGIGTHESLEIDDEVGLDSSFCEQRDLQATSSLSSSSSPSSASLSSSHTDKQLSEVQIESSELSSLSSSLLMSSMKNIESKQRETPAKVEDVNDEDDESEPQVEILNYKLHMEKKIHSLPIPLMLKKFLMFDRI